MLKVTKTASEVASEKVNNRRSKEDVSQVSSQRFWTELTLVYELHLICDIAHSRTYTTLLGVQCTIRSGQHTCLLFWRSWVRLASENQLCCHTILYYVHSGFLSNFEIFPMKAGVYFHGHICIKKNFPRLMLCTGIYYNWGIVVKYFGGTEKGVSTEIPKHVLCLFSRTNDTGNASIPHNLGTIM